MSPTRALFFYSDVGIVLRVLLNSVKAGTVETFDKVCPLVFQNDGYT